MNTIISMNHSLFHPDNRFVPVQKLTRREELLIDLRVADEAIEMAQRYPEQLSAEFLAEQQKRREEILAELKQMDEEVAK